MRLDFNISQTELGKFRTACEATIRNVGTGTQAATTEAGLSIMADSLSQVPVDTGTLRDSAYLGTSRRNDVSGYRYGAVLGYGTPEGLSSNVGLSDEGSMDWYIVPNNGVNPKNHLQASTYAAKVHEDLDMPHPNGGKAKFLEDPVRNWASGKFMRTAMTYWKQAITYSNKGHMTKRYNKGIWKPVFTKIPRIEARIKFTQQRTSVQRGGKTVHKGAD